eukprot:5050628-Prymnesium_polylepis.1
MVRRKAVLGRYVRSPARCLWHERAWRGFNLVAGVVEGEVGGRGPADTQGVRTLRVSTWLGRPGEEEEATCGIATCGASESARPEGGGSTR